MPEAKAEPKLMRDAFSKVTDRFREDLTAQGFRVVSELTWAPCYIDVNDEYLRRIFENIASNVLKYAEPSADVLISTLDSSGSCGFSVMNTCAVSDSRVESNWIGIESIRTMMGQMNGSCTVEQTDTAYEITLLFPKQ